jgi:hypothetical protein
VKWRTIVNINYIINSGPVVQTQANSTDIRELHGGMQWLIVVTVHKRQHLQLITAHLEALGYEELEDLVGAILCGRVYRKEAVIHSVNSSLSLVFEPLFTRTLDL